GSIMNMHRSSFYFLLILILGGCVSTEEIDFESTPEAKNYKCLKTTSQALITRKWDLCPLLSFEPVLSKENWSLRVNPSQKYIAMLEERAKLLGKNARHCEVPTAADEYLLLPKGTVIKISQMNKHRDKSFSGIEFKGLLNFEGQEFNLEYRKSLPGSDNILGYDISKYFNSCEGN
ncbi:hypothetical protein, partial [Pseudoalteromonas sp. MTN2-4]|uniref:hypothetical protein n=1 Tax=Pseudoalteromonas sp. MTN2-4 TaxID=3056555 RepID=UPI0036F220D7